MLNATKWKVSRLLLEKWRASSDKILYSVNMQNFINFRLFRVIIFQIGKLDYHSPSFTRRFAAFNQNNFVFHFFEINHKFIKFENR